MDGRRGRTLRRCAEVRTDKSLEHYTARPDLRCKSRHWEHERMTAGIEGVFGAFRAWPSIAPTAPGWGNAERKARLFHRCRLPGRSPMRLTNRREDRL